ncbi:GNAT family N-acetyltransferase [Actinospongicola halichondriae]|uniref:GNAT family N-acetyltransferase n=1 Tax=Actinospongicola halichondriae TaxID=3236844 RepID=UPI003D3B4FF1
MGPSNIDTRLLASGEVASMAAALARSFHDDPIMEHLVPERDHVERIARFFTVDLTVLQVRGEVHVTPGLEGGALWAAPGQWRMPLREIVRHAVPTARAFGPRVPRALKTLSVIEAHHPEEPHWYLAVLGTDPTHQGKGIGSALLAPVLDRCDDEGVGAYLESSKESNIPFYRRHGFVVTEEIALPNGPSAWGMWRDPAPR